MRQAYLAFVLLPGLLFLESCSPRPHEPTETYILVASNTRIPYWQAAYAGLRKAGAEMGVRVEMVGPSGYVPQKEKEELESEIQERPAGILISAADPALMADDINSAIDAGIPVVTIDSDVPSSKRLFFVGSNNFEAGRLGGQRLVKLLGGKGNVVMFTYPKQENLIERQQGYQSVFDDYPDINLTQAVDIHGDPALAYRTAKQLLTSKAKVDAFVCLEAIACPEVADVVSQVNPPNKVTILAMDTDQRTLKGIQSGLISATIAQKPYSMGYLGVQMLDAVHHHNLNNVKTNYAQEPYSPFPTFVDTGTFIVDKANLGSSRSPNLVSQLH